MHALPPYASNGTRDTRNEADRTYLRGDSGSRLMVGLDPEGEGYTGSIAIGLRLTLTPTPSGTHLSLVHSGFKADQKQNFAGARYGWKMMGGKLVDLLTRIP